MKKTLLLVGPLLAAITSVALRAQDGICDFDWHPHYEQLTRYVNLFVDGTGPGTDAKTLLMRVETPDPTSELPGVKETWYVARSSQGSETAPFYRLYGAGAKDHMDSPSSTEGEYALSLNLDYPWLSAAMSQRTPAGGTASGLTPLRRYIKSSPFDHQTWLHSQAPPGYTLDATYDGGTTRLGYQRFGNNIQKQDVLGTNGSGPAYGTHFLDNGILRVDYNKVWGNGVGRITQVSSGRQIVSEPIGDMVQTVVRFAAFENTTDPDCRNPNPTQSGSVWHNTLTQPNNYGKTEYWTGSPVLTTVKSQDASGNPQTFTSVVRPFEFANNGEFNNTGRWPGTEDKSPLAWKGFTERTDSLGCKMAGVTRKDVIKTTSRLILAPNNGLNSHNVLWLNTHWLKAWDLVNDATPVVWDFTIECLNLRTGIMRSLLSDANGNVILNQNDSTCGDDDGDLNTPPDDHAIIVSRRDGAFGYAMARLNLVVGENSNVVFRCAVNPCSSKDKGAVILQATRHAYSSRSTLSKSAWSYPLESFLVVNNRSVIVTRVNEIRADGGSCSE